MEKEEEEDDGQYMNDKTKWKFTKSCPLFAKRMNNYFTKTNICVISKLTQLKSFNIVFVSTSSSIFSKVFYKEIIVYRLKTLIDRDDNLLCYLRFLLGFIFNGMKNL